MGGNSAESGDCPGCAWLHAQVRPSWGKFRAAMRCAFQVVPCSSGDQSMSFHCKLKLASPGPQPAGSCLILIVSLLLTSYRLVFREPSIREAIPGGGKVTRLSLMPGGTRCAYLPSGRRHLQERDIPLSDILPRPGRQRSNPQHEQLSTHDTSVSYRCVAWYLQLLLRRLQSQIHVARAVCRGQGRLIGYGNPVQQPMRSQRYKNAPDCLSGDSTERMMYVPFAVWCSRR
jgi:hypothetical protein